MLKGAVCIVYISVKHNSAIFLNVLELDRHSFQRSIEYTRIIDIVPGIEKVIGAFEFRELVHPELLSIGVEEIHESGVTWPRLSIQSLSFNVSHVNVLRVAFFPFGVL